MFLPSPKQSRSTRRRALTTGVLAALAWAAAAPAARAQDAVTSKEVAAAVKAAFLVDLEGLRSKFLALAEAFPQDRYGWRPMDGVRSTSEVLMQIAVEGYTFIPGGFGAKPADVGGREEIAKLRLISDKAQVIDQLNKGFAYAKMAIEAVDPATLTGKRRVMGQETGVAGAASLVGGDLHEHLGQLIAYARTGHIVPPWSK